MAEIRRDLFGRPYITGVEADLERIERDRQFTADMQGIGTQLNDDLSSAVKSSVADTAMFMVGGALLTRAMVKNRSFRYKTQAFLHIFMAWIAAFLLCTAILMNASPSMSHEKLFGTSAVVGLVVGIIWTGLYVHFRTKPKLRALQNQ